MTEIGGYFELERFPQKPYYPDLLALNSGRNALTVLLAARGKRQLHLPYYLCDSVSNACLQSGIELTFYAVGPDFLPVIKQPLNPEDTLYVVNYFGQVGEEKATALQARYPGMILDNTQAFFQRPLPGMDTLYTCRKFFGVPDGAYLASQAPLPQDLKEGRSAHRMGHLLGRREDSASAHYQTFKDNDCTFDTEGPAAMSDLTKQLLGAIDYEQARQQREDNYAVLQEHLKEQNPLRLQAPQGPFCYPFYHQDGMRIKQELAKQKIYVPTLWPNVLTSPDELARDYAKNILPLPCDQRYQAKDMQTIIKELRTCIN